MQEVDEIKSELIDVSFSQYVKLQPGNSFALHNDWGSY